MADGSQYKPIEKKMSGDDTKLDVIIVGAGLGGVGAAIAILLAGHNVTILESASEIGEVGAGIQILGLRSPPRALCHASQPDQHHRLERQPAHSNGHSRVRSPVSRDLLLGFSSRTLAPMSGTTGYGPGS